MLSVGELSRITKELILGLEPGLTTPEAMEARRDIDADLIQMRKDGIMPDLPSDFDDLPPLPPPPPAPTEEERLESKNRLIRASLASSWGFALSIEAEEKADAQCCGAFLTRIEAVPLMSEPDRRQLLGEVADCERSGELATWSAARVRQRLDRAVRRALAPKKRRKRKQKR